MPFLGAWLVLAARTRRFVPTWLVAVPLGVAIRMVALSHYRWSELAFLAVSLVVIGALAGALHFVHPRRTSSTTREHVQ